MKKIVVCVILCFSIYLRSTIAIRPKYTALIFENSELTKESYENLTKQDNNTSLLPFSIHNLLFLANLSSPSSTHKPSTNVLHVAKTESTTERYKSVTEDPFKIFKERYPIISGNGEFTNKLYQVLAKTDGNILFSPLSIHIVLSMVYRGSKGSTYEALKNVLSFPKTERNYREERIWHFLPEGSVSKSNYSIQYKQIFKQLNSVQNVTLLTANAVYIMEGLEIVNDFNKIISEQYFSRIQSVNFAYNVNAASSINKWIEEKTNDKIKDLIKSHDLDVFTRLVLVNAIYFKGYWFHQFDKKFTKTEPFYINNYDTVQVQMMHIHQKFKYAEYNDIKARVLVLPYANSNISMIIILPIEHDGINEVEKRLSEIKLHEITQLVHKKNIHLALPKFKFEKSLDLENDLTELGLGVIFDKIQANFSGMVDKPANLYVSKVMQKAVIEIDEEGSEAASATGISTLPLSSDHDYNMEHYIVDHPFIYIIGQSTTRTIFHNYFEEATKILFMGRVTTI